MSDPKYVEALNYAFLVDENERLRARIKELELQDEIKLQASTIWMNRSAIWMDRALAAEARIAELLQGGT